jgi:transposase
MLSIDQETRVFFRRGATDMRKSFDGLSALAFEMVRREPELDWLFVFLNRRRTIVKILSWDRDGIALYAKRLERGTYREPAMKDGAMTIDRARLALMLDGLDALEVKPRKRWRRNPKKT